MRLQQAIPRDSFSFTRLADNALDLLRLSSLDQHSARTTEPRTKGTRDYDPADTSLMSLPRPLGLNDESDGHIQDHRQRRKRRRSAL